MSAAIFDTVNVVKNDRSILGVTQLPTVTELRRHALAAPYVLRYEASDADVSGAYDAHRPSAAGSAARTGLTETVALAVAPGTLTAAVAAAVRTELERHWPTTLQEWPLCEVGSLWLARPAGRRAGPGTTSMAYGEMLCASRWEVVGTVFALERYQVVRVPLRTEAAWRRWQECTLGPSASASHGTTVVWGDGLRDALLTTATTTTSTAPARPGPASTQRSTPLSALGRCPLESVEQASQVVVECTVCRVLSSAEGEPPVPHVAAQRLLGLTDAALRECFFGTCVPLLGVAQEERGRRWQKMQLEQELNRSFSPCSATEADNSGLQEGGHTTTTMSGGSPAHGHVSFSTDASDLNVHWDGVPVASASLTLSARARRPYEARASHSTVLASQRGSTLSSSSYTAAQDAQAWQHFALGRSNHVAWQLMSMPSVFELDYFSRAGEGWRRWRDLCGGGINRHLIVNSIDEIVDYCACSRRAFYAAVACLDRFVATTTDPAENCRAYLRTIGVPDTTPINMDRIVTFFTQVITVCAMLGCKNMDLYPPHVNKVLLCLKPTMRLSLSDFDALEVHILASIQFNIQPVTLDSVVETLLYACGTDAFQENTLDVRHYAALFDTTRAGEQYLKEDFQARMSAAAASVQARRHHQEELRAAMCRVNGLDEVGPSPNSGADVTVTPADVWDDFCQFARFLSDQLIRGGKSLSASPSPEDAPSSPRAEAEAWALEGYLWALPPVLLATAIFVVTAEMFDVPLPAPLFWLLPETYQDGLRAKNLSPGRGADTATTLSAVTQPHAEDDDARVVLKYFVTLLHSAAGTLASEANLLRGGHSGNNRGSQEMMSSAIGVVQHVYQHCRNTPCDKPLLKRYQALFRRLNPVS